MPNSYFKTWFWKWVRRVWKFISTKRNYKHKILHFFHFSTFWCIFSMFKNKNYKFENKYVEATFEYQRLKCVRPNTLNLGEHIFLKLNNQGGSYKLFITQTQFVLSFLKFPNSFIVHNIKQNVTHYNVHWCVLQVFNNINISINPLSYNLHINKPMIMPPTFLKCGLSIGFGTSSFVSQCKPLRPHVPSHQINK